MAGAGLLSIGIVGMHFTGMTAVTIIPDARVSVPADAVQGLARHNVKEFTRYRDFLPRIYKELGGSLYC